MVNVQGKLTTPTGSPLRDTVIKFEVFRQTETQLLGVTVHPKTDKEGKYSFNLVEGQYHVYLLHNDEYFLQGDVFINSETPSPISLSDLINQSKLPEVSLLDPNQDSWNSMYNDVLDNDELKIRDVHKTSDGEVVTLAERSVHRNADGATIGRIQHTSLNEHSTASTGVFTYEDKYNNHSSEYATELHTGSATYTHGIHSGTRSSGETSLSEETTFSDQSGSHSVGYSVSGSTQTITDETTTYETTRSATGLTEKSLSNVGRYTGFGYESNLKVSSVSGVPRLDMGTSFLGGNLAYNGRALVGEDTWTVSTESGVTNKEVFNTKTMASSSGQPLVHFDADNYETTFYGKVNFLNIDDIKGDEGYSYDWEFKYSNDQGVYDPWRSDYKMGDIWRWQRKFRFRESNPTVTKEWVGDAEIIQLNARDGLDGDNYILEHEYTTLEEYPSGWRQQYLQGDDWRRWRTVTTDHEGLITVGEWYEERLKGDDGKEGLVPEIQAFYGSDATKPLFIGEDDGCLAGINLSHWHPNFSAGDIYKYERRVWWETQEDFSNSRNDYTLMPFIVEEWVLSKIIPVKGEDYFDGVDGAAGEDGKQGRGTYIVRATSFPTNDNQIETIVRNTKGADVEVGEYVQYIVENQGSQYYERVVGTVSTTTLVVWKQFPYVFNGDVFVDGTIAGNKLKVADVDGDRIKASSYILVGSGTNIAGINGNDTHAQYKDYRFWSGATTPAASNFSVDKYGKLVANNAVIKGHVEANSGTFTGELNATSGVFNNVTIKDTCVIENIKLTNLNGLIGGTFYIKTTAGFSSLSRPWDTDAPSKYPLNSTVDLFRRAFGFVIRRDGLNREGLIHKVIMSSQVRQGWVVLDGHGKSDEYTSGIGLQVRITPCDLAGNTPDKDNYKIVFDSSVDGVVRWQYTLGNSSSSYNNLTVPDLVYSIYAPNSDSHMFQDIAFDIPDDGSDPSAGYLVEFGVGVRGVVTWAEYDGQSTHPAFGYVAGGFWSQADNVPISIIVANEDTTTTQLAVGTLHTKLNT